MSFRRFSDKKIIQKFGSLGLAALLLGAFSATNLVLLPSVSALNSVFNGDDFVYDWETVNVGAGGFVVGLNFADDGSLVVKTDVGGAYIWNNSSQQMEQLLNTDSMPSAYSNPDSGDGVHEIALAPSNSDVIYMYWNDRLFKSTNRGDSFSELTAFGSSHTAQANGQYRTHNNKIAVDPINPDVVYVGTEADGLFVSYNGGTSFSDVTDVADGTGQRGITAITFDRNSGATGGRTNTVYATSYSNGLYRTTNAGTSWTAVSGSPTDVSDMEVQSNGDLYVAASSENTVYEYTQVGTTWDDLSPSYPGATNAGATDWSLALDPTNDDRLFVINEAGSLTYTLNGGSSWNSGTNNREADDIPWLEWVDEPWFSTAELDFNPANPNQLFLAQGIGVWMLDVSSNPSGTFNWQSRSSGIEELVTRDILSIEGRDRVLLSAMDRPIFVSDSSNEFPTVVHPDDKFNNGWSMANSANDPDYVVALVSDYISNRGPLNAVFSTDGGSTWTSFPVQPGPTPGATYPYWGSGGNIAVGAPGNVVVVPSSDSVANSTAYYTTDGGASWDAVTGLPDALITNRNFARHILTADGATPGTFYAFDSDGSTSNTVYRSTDSGANWSAMGVPAGATFTQYNAKLRSVPGQAGELYFTAGHQSGGGAGGNPYDFGSGLYHSVDGGANWTAVPNMTEVYDIGFGAAASGQSYPSMYTVGFYNHVYGIWRSFDGGISWHQIGDTPTGVINRISYIIGDMNDPNCSYVGFSGTGWAKGCVRGASTTDPGDDDGDVGGDLSNTGTNLLVAVPAITIVIGAIYFARKRNIYRLHR